MFKKTSEQIAVGDALDITDPKKRTAAYAGAAHALTAFVYRGKVAPASDDRIKQMTQLEELIYGVNELAILDMPGFKAMVKNYTDLLKAPCDVKSKIMPKSLLGALSITSVFGEGVMAIIDENIAAYTLAYNNVFAYCEYVANKANEIETAGA